MTVLTSPYLCPETLIETTLGNLKSQTRSGFTNGATNPPLAASTWMGVSSPFLMRSSLIACTSSYWPVYVVPRIAQMPMVFSSTMSTACTGSITYRVSVHGTSFSAISKYLAAFSQQTWTPLLMMRFGLEASFPWALRLISQRFFIARVAIMIASEDPIHDVPKAVGAPSETGEWNRSARMFRQRCSISTDFGYSSWSMMFLFADSASSLRASSSCCSVSAGQR